MELTAFPFLFAGGSDRAEQPIGLVIRTGCKIERVGIRVSAAAQSQCPQSVDGDRLSLTVPESSAKVAIGVECNYLPIAKITDEDVTAEAAKPEFGGASTELSAIGALFRDILVEHTEGILFH